MPLREMPAFVFSHKHVLRAVICALLSCFLLIAELILMKSSVIGIVFDVIIPFTAAVTFGCYAITMAMDRPFILICPPTVYFLSLLINQFETYNMMECAAVVALLILLMNLLMKGIIFIIKKIGANYADKKTI